MSKAVANRKDDLFDQGWKALVAKLGIVDATRFVMRLSGGTGDYTKFRRKLFAGRGVDELAAATRSVRSARPLRKNRSRVGKSPPSE